MADAQAVQDEKQKQQHLDAAYKALGGDEQSKQQPKDDKSQKGSKSKETQQKKMPEQPQPGREKQEKTDDKTAEQLLKMLKDEENQRRDDLMKVRQMRRAPVKKDW